MAIVKGFRPAERMQCKASVLIEGLSGKGKSGLALAMAYALAGDWEKVAAVDTENRSLPLYVGTKLHTGVTVEGFSVVDITAEDGYRPTTYAAYQEVAVNSGFESLVCDSISHMWQYKGGVLDLVTEIQRREGNRYNKYTAWGDPDVVREKNTIMSIIRHHRLHVINTVRVKEKMEMITDENNKTALRSLGEQQIIMPDLKYEPDLVLSMVRPGSSSGEPPKVRVIKSRYSVFTVDEEYEMTEKILRQLKMFLEEGTSPDELLAMQLEDYREAITAYLDTHANLRPVWDALKENEGLKGVALKDMVLKDMKKLFTQLTA